MTNRHLTMSEAVAVEAVVEEVGPDGKRIVDLHGMALLATTTLGARIMADRCHHRIEAGLTEEILEVHRFIGLAPRTNSSPDRSPDRGRFPEPPIDQVSQYMHSCESSLTLA